MLLYSYLSREKYLLLEITSFFIETIGVVCFILNQENVRVRVRASTSGGVDVANNSNNQAVTEDGAGDYE